MLSIGRCELRLLKIKMFCIHNSNKSLISVSASYWMLLLKIRGGRGQKVSFIYLWFKYLKTDMNNSLFLPFGVVIIVVSHLKL